MPPPRQRAERFTYDGFTIDEAAGRITCSYSTEGHRFHEQLTFGPSPRFGDPAVIAAARLLYLLAGVSYYKTTAARVIDLGLIATTADERAFLARYYRNGLGEFAYRNSLDLRDLEVVGPERAASHIEPYEAIPGRPLIPFGGGIDSIVTVAGIRERTDDAALCIVHPPGQRFAAIDDAAAVTALPVISIARAIDPLVRRSSELGFFNGHVPITAVITAAAIVAAVLDRRDAVVLSNERSASVPTLIHDGRPINHQWSKGLEFEQGLAYLVAASLGPELSVFSYLRARSELWVARQFAPLSEFHQVFRSCNRAFHQDPSERHDRWCGKCDKCCFIDLILAPFIPAATLRRIFDGHEPLDAAALEPQFATLLGLSATAKPFECVGDVDECRAALALIAQRPDRADSQLVHRLAEALPEGSADDSVLTPLGPHYIPERYAPPDLVV